jgi:hypothetical protein
MKRIQLLNGIYVFSFYLFCFVFGRTGDSECYTCKADTLPLDPHLQTICPGYFGNGGLMNYSPGWPRTMIFLITAYQVVRIIGVNHQHLAV